MATTALTMEQDTDAIEQMALAADETIAELDRACTDIDAKIAELHTEQATLAQAQEARVAHLIEKGAALTSLGNDYSLAEAYAKLAHRTSNEHRAVKDVSQQKKAHQAAKKEFDTLERETIEANQTDATRSADINKQLHLLEFEKETHRGEIESVQIGRRKVYAELGRQRYEIILGKWHELQGSVDTAEQALLTAQVKQHEYYEQALNSLEAWPDLQQDVARLRPEDNTYRVIEASLSYVDTLLHHAAQLKKDVPLPYPLQQVLFLSEGIYGSTMAASLLVDNLGDVLFANADGVMLPDRLIARRQKLQQTLDAYRAYLTTTEGR